jgi:mono/diheme cytochrome c family protein
MLSMNPIRLAYFASLFVALPGGSVLCAEEVDFGSTIQPIFSEHCYDCHGPEKQKSGLRLDLRAAALRGGDEGVAIVPGKSGESLLIAHVTASVDDEKRMPPRDHSEDGLTSEQIAALTKWIDSGAPWPDALAGKDERLSHWAWQPVAKQEDLLPAAHPGNPVDFFVQRKLKEAGLTMSPKADRRTLIRRLSFDLLGMPPSPGEVEAFVSDPDPMAYEKLIDRLLDSPHYGERYARHWLDIAHYADTHGFERDKRRDSAWRYRDYVISAFNEDKPYDRFLREQIAGDVLFPKDAEAVVATGFLAAGPWDFVGQVETKSPVLRRSARALDLDDMATQVMTATMAMTVNCARCHDHKLDPISQEEYYQLWSVFAGVKREERVISETALQEYEGKKDKLMAERDRLDFEIGRREGKGFDLADIVGGGNGLGTGKFRAGIDVRSAAVQEREFGRLGNVKVNHFAKSKFDFLDGVVVPDGQDGKAEVPVSSTGLTVTGLPSTSGEAWDMIRNGPVASQHSNELGGIDFTKGGHSLIGLHANAGITFDLEAIRRASGEAALRFTTSVGYFGKEGTMQADVWVLLDGRKVVELRGLKRSDGIKPVDIPVPEAARFLTLLSLDGGNGIGHDQVGFGDARLKPTRSGDLSPEEEKELTQLRSEKTRLDAKIAELGDPPRVYAVVAEEEIPEIRILRRGDPESPVGGPLPPGAFAVLENLDPNLGTLETGQGERRVALANWITDPENPLTSRVLVNRLWHWLFGQGIVNTPSDFGLGGDRPSHPELLDWLAGEFAKGEGSIKAMQRLLLTSETYQQESRYSEASPGVAVDAGNRLLWRQNPRRIEAEAVRDAVLSVSGKLNRKRGGPGFEDFDYKEAYAPIYTYETADEPALWRRSIYRYLVRTTPNRFMTTMDCPDPANLTPARMTTTTALQSLALYNNEFMLLQAGYFAKRVEQEVGPDPDKQVARCFALAFGREPSREEAAMARDFLKAEGLFSFCRSLFNANEFVYVD